MTKFTRWVASAALLLLLAIPGTGCTAKLKAAYHQKRADQYYDAGQFDQAEIEYKNVLHNAPQNARAWSRLGLIYFNEGRIGDAAQILTRASQMDTNNFEVRIKLGIVYLEAGKSKEARDAASFVLAKDPQNAKAPLLLVGAAISTNEIIETRLLLQKMAGTADSAPVETALGTLSLRLGDLKTAGACFQTAVRLDPKFSDAYSALGNFYLAQNDEKQAEQAFKTAMDLPPPRPEKTVLYAQFKILSGDADAGKSLLQGQVKATPYYLPAWIALAQLAGVEKDYAGGVTLLGNVLSRDPRNLEALLLKGRFEMAAGQTAQAIIDFDKMTKSFPNLPVAYFQLAQAQTAIDDFDNATVNLNQALKLNPNYADAILLLAEVQMYHENFDTAVASLQQLIRRQPQLIHASLLLARAYSSRGRLGSAVQTYRDLEKMYPTNSQIHLLLGTTLLQQTNHAGARTEFDEALKLNPDFLPALEQEVNLDLMEKNYTVARQRVQQQITQHTNAAPLQLLLARVQIARGETNEAESTLKNVIAQSPDSPPAYLMLAQLYAADHENQKALADLSAALAKDPKDGGALLLMGMTYNAEKDYDHACDAYEKLLTVSSNSVAALNNLAYIYAQNLGQLDKGYELASRARKLAPADSSTADTFGWILYQQGQYSSALGPLQESAAKNETVPDVQFHLGMTYYAMADEVDARAMLQRALQLNGDFPEKDECNQCLAVLAIDPKTAGADQQALLEKRVASQPKDSLAQLRLAAIFEREGSTDKAVSAYETALQTSPQNVPALVNLARLYASSDPQKGLNLAKTAYKLAPSDPQVSHTLGHIAFLTGDYVWSLSLLQLTARNQPQDAEVLYDLGEAFYSVGRVPDARSAMQNALQNNARFSHADDARRFLTLTGLADQPAQAVAAQSQIEDILKATPDYVPALMARAAIAEQKPDPATAQQVYEAVLNHYPDFAPAQKQLVLLYAKDSKNDAKASPLAVKALRAFPDDPDVSKALGMIVYRQGDFSRAASLLTASARQKNNDAELMYYLGMAQYQLKNNVLCKTDLQKALDLKLSDTQAADAKRILADLK